MYTSIIDRAEQCGVNLKLVQADYSCGFIFIPTVDLPKLANGIYLFVDGPVELLTHIILYAYGYNAR